MPHEIAATWSRSGMAASIVRDFIQVRQSLRRDQAPRDGGGAGAAVAWMTVAIGP